MSKYLEKLREHKAMIFAEPALPQIADQ